MNRSGIGFGEESESKSELNLSLFGSENPKKSPASELDGRPGIGCAFGVARAHLAGVTFGDFWVTFWRVVRTTFVMVFRRRFFSKKNDFSKSCVLLKREHHF